MIEYNIIDKFFSKFFDISINSFLDDKIIMSNENFDYEDDMIDCLDDSSNRNILLEYFKVGKKSYKFINFMYEKDIIKFNKIIDEIKRNNSLLNELENVNGLNYEIKNNLVNGDSFFLSVFADANIKKFFELHGYNLVLKFLDEIQDIKILVVKKRYLLLALKEDKKYVYDKLMEYTDINAFIDACFIDSEKDYVRECFEVIKNNDNLDKFLSNPRRDVVLFLARVFGDKEHDINHNNKIFKFNFVNKFMISRYLKLRNIINVDIDILGSYPFGRECETGVYSLIKQNRIDADWCVSDDIEMYIKSITSRCKSLEEIVSLVYIGLCYVLEYNSSAHVIEYNYDYSKERQESINLNNRKIVCGEFSKLFCKIVNEFEGVEGRCVSRSGRHESVRVLFRSSNKLIGFEATDLIGDFNDLARVKLGLEIKGVKNLVDRDNKFINTFEHVYEDFLNNYGIDTDKLVCDYNKLSGGSFSDKLELFLSSTGKKVRGNELINAFYLLNKNGFFGRIKCAYMGVFMDEEIRRDAIIECAGVYYLLNSVECTFKRVSLSELRYYFSNGIIRYEDDIHVFKEIEGGYVKELK